MDETGKLRKKLVRLAAAGRADTTGRLTAGQGASLVVEFLRKVDDIMLARRLVLVAPDRPDFSCIVANRAVIEFGTAGEEPTKLDVMDSERTEAFCSHLERFLEGLDEVTFRTERLPRDGRSLSGGVTADYLAVSRGESLLPATTPDGPGDVARFLEDNRHRISAWCRKQGDVVESGGNPDGFETVQAFLDEMERQLLGDGHGLVDDGTSDVLFVISAAESGADSLMFSRHDDIHLALAAADDAIPALCAEWRVCCPAQDA